VQSIIFVNNPLELLGQYVGHTAPAVDKKVGEAKGGVLFIDEAYCFVSNVSHSIHCFACVII
jgi:SpoVK/Ycf46/Vps4 family AAA+-type ATPase